MDWIILDRIQERAPNFWRRTWHTCKNGLTTDEEHRGGLELAGERSNNFLQVADINAISLMEPYRAHCRDQCVLAHAWLTSG
jgi:hypothetical protein